MDTGPTGKANRAPTILCIRLEGREDGDWFGASVAVIGDVNGDTFTDLLVGAPMERNGEGRAYVFYGPFRDIENPVLNVEDADFVFRSPAAENFEFGSAVRAVADVNCDDVPDIAIGGYFLGGVGNQVLTHTFIVSGSTGESIYEVVGSTPFDPWTEVVGDAEGDGDVDQNDIDIVTRNQGRTGPDLTLRDGDFNADQAVDGVDLALAQANLGHNHFAGIRICTPGCPPPIPPGFHCVENCEGELEPLPENVWPDCRPILCPQNCGCAYQVLPAPANGMQTPHQVDRDIHTMIQVTADLNNCATWTILEGASAMANISSGCASFEFTPIEYGATVVVRADYECCQGSCSVTIPFFITCNGHPDPVGDIDFDDLTNWEEHCLFGTDESVMDTDDDGMADGWEVMHGFDPLFAGDAAGDADNDDIPNVLESLYGSNPHGHNDLDPYGLDTSLDADGDMFIDWLETQYGTDPFDPLDMPAVSELNIDPADMSWMVVNDVVQDVEGNNIEMCEGDCFRFHATGWAMSWTVVDGQELLDEVEPDSLDGCISAKWCITGAGDITIMSSTPAGVTPLIGFVHITALSEQNCEDECRLKITDGAGGPPPDKVCVGEELTFDAVPDTVHNQELDCEECDGDREWEIESDVGTSGFELIGTPSQQITIRILKPATIWVTATQGECSGGATLQPVLVDLDIDSDNQDGHDVPADDPEEDATEDDPDRPGKFIMVRDELKTPVRLSVGDGQNAQGTWTLTFPDRIKVWTTTGEEIENGVENQLPAPSELLIEGVEPSDAKGDVLILLEANVIIGPDSSIQCSDSVRATCFVLEFVGRNPAVEIDTSGMPTNAPDACEFIFETEALNVSNFVSDSGWGSDSYASASLDADNLRVHVQNLGHDSGWQVTLKAMRNGVLKDASPNVSLSQPHPDVTRIRRTKAQRLVSDEPDDGARCLLVELGDEVHVEYKPRYDVGSTSHVSTKFVRTLQVGLPHGQGESLSSNQRKHDILTLNIRIHVFRHPNGNNFVIDETEVQKDLTVLRERMAQATIRVLWEMEGDEPKLYEHELPEDNSLDGGLIVSGTEVNCVFQFAAYNDGEQHIISLNDADDGVLDVFYIYGLQWQGAEKHAAAYFKATNVTGAPNGHNFIVMNTEHVGPGGGSPSGPLTLAHEVMHILLDMVHRAPPCPAPHDPETSLFANPDQIITVDAQKRIGPNLDTQPTTAAGDTDTFVIRGVVETLP